MIGWRSKKVPQAHGFTLIEVIVTMALFSMTVLMAVTLLVVFIQQQRRAVSQEQLQNDIRAVMERMTTELREGRIDYDYYVSTFPLVPKKLFDALDGQGDNALVLVDVLNQRVMYRVNANVLQRCAPTATLDCTGTDVWENISPSSLQVQAFTFYISPSHDPFANLTPLVCGTAGDPPVPDDADCTIRWGTICAALDSTGVPMNRCALRRGNDTIQSCYCVPQQLNGLSPLHPRVTFSIQAQRTVGQNTVSDIFQTTVASRLFQNIERLNQYAP